MDGQLLGSQNHDYDDDNDGYNNNNNNNNNNKVHQRWSRGIALLFL